mmetsp:Transcript_11647/g.34979  ORF Transcript_11647/g.34979 Transcript_11647/m.34979 type:complete len:275 (-) Transcript_11647:1116-1940(-)
MSPTGLPLCGGLSWRWWLRRGGCRSCCPARAAPKRCTGSTVRQCRAPTRAPRKCVWTWSSLPTTTCGWPSPCGPSRHSTCCTPWRASTAPPPSPGPAWTSRAPCRCRCLHCRTSPLPFPGSSRPSCWQPSSRPCRAGPCPGTWWWWEMKRMQRFSPQLHPSPPPRRPWRPCLPPRQSLSCCLHLPLRPLQSRHYRQIRWRQQRQSRCPWQRTCTCQRLLLPQQQLLILLLPRSPQLRCSLQQRRPRDPQRQLPATTPPSRGGRCAARARPMVHL